MKIVLFADGNVGQNIFRFLFENHPTDLICVITTAENSIYNFAKNNNIKVACFIDLEESLDGVYFDYGVLAWWPKIINESLISRAKKGFINTHPSLLPYNRGKHYNFWAIVEESPFGVSIHMVEKNVDTGPIIAQKTISYSWLDNGESLYNKAQNEMLNLFKDFYPSFRDGIFKLKYQDISEGSFHKSSELINASKIELDKKYLGRNILNMLRAKTFEGFQGCWFEENGINYEITIKIKNLKK